MSELIKPYLLAFIPIFVAVDAIGSVPLFLSILEGTGKKERNRIIRDSVATATILAVIFMFCGTVVFKLLGITIPDFQIAGGALLFVIAMRLLLPGNHKGNLANGHDKGVGVFPLGTPLITGPAVLATTLIMLDTYGIVPTFVSLLLNMAIVWITLAKADLIMKLIGTGGTRAFAKVMYILLAAIAVMMIRRGVMGIIVI